MNKKFVIYKVTNMINNKIYIGKTYNFEKRKREHIYDIDNGLPFHRALKKYGLENFVWEIIDRADTDEEIKKKEIYWISELHACIHDKESNGYNITLGGEGGVSWNSKPIVQFDLQGNYIDEFVSCSCASVTLKLDRKSIERACKLQCAVSGGYQWKYKSEWNGKNIGDYKKKESTRKRKILQLDKQGYVLNAFESITKASELTKTSRTALLGCLSGRYKLANSYIWIYANDYDITKDYSYKGIEYQKRKILQLDNNGNIINEFNNCAEAARGIGLDSKAHKLIHHALTSKSHLSCGYKWIVNQN